MRRTVDVDDKLLREAQEVFGTSTIKETVELGLREAVRRRRLEELRRSLGSFELDLTPEELEKLRDEE